MSSTSHFGIVGFWSREVKRQGQVSIEVGESYRKLYVKGRLQKVSSSQLGRTRTKPNLKLRDHKKRKKRTKTKIPEKLWTHINFQVVLYLEHQNLDGLRNFKHKHDLRFFMKLAEAIPMPL